MSSTLEFDGKKYISARDAADLTGYTPDYIGQLARSEKFKTQMVGRSRFVEIEGLKKYAEEIQKERHENGKNQVVYTRGPSRDAEIPQSVASKQQRGESTPDKHSVISAPSVALMPRLVALAIALVLVFGSYAFARNDRLVNAGVDAIRSTMIRSGEIVLTATAGLREPVEIIPFAAQQGTYGVRSLSIAGGRAIQETILFGKKTEDSIRIASEHIRSFARVGDVAGVAMEKFLARADRARELLPDGERIVRVTASALEKVQGYFIRTRTYIASPQNRKALSEKPSTFVWPRLSAGAPVRSLSSASGATVIDIRGGWEAVGGVRMSIPKIDATAAREVIKGLYARATHSVGSARLFVTNWSLDDGFAGAAPASPGSSAIHIEEGFVSFIEGSRTIARKALNTDISQWQTLARGLGARVAEDTRIASANVLDSLVGNVKGLANALSRGVYLSLCGVFAEPLGCGTSPGTETIIVEREKPSDPVVVSGPRTIVERVVERGQVYSGVTSLELASAINELRDELEPEISVAKRSPTIEQDTTNYLPTTGGTLSGALSGTSATFSSTLSVSASTTLNSITYGWPGADGTDGQALTTDGTGNLAWETIVSSGASDIFELFNTTGIRATTTNKSLLVGALATTTTSLLEVAGTGTFLDALTAYGILTGPSFTATTTATSTFPTLSVTGRLYDGGGTGGVSGYVLQSDGTSVNWVATSTLGIAGTTEFTGLTDTQNSLTANRIIHTNAGGTALSDTAGFVFDGTNLGIGTTSPYAKLSVVGPVVAEYFHATSTGSTNTFAGNLTVTGNTVRFQNAADSTTGFQVLDADGGTPIFNIDTTNERVGIGTASPSAALHIEATNEILRLADTSVSGNPFLSFYQTTTRRSYIQSLDSNNELRLASEYGDITFFTGVGGSETQKVVITDSGNVGVGDTSPDAHLEVSADGGSGGNIFLLSSNDDNDGDLLTVTEGGNLGVGTTSPYARLSVAGDTVLDSNTITFGSSTASLLNVIYGSAATSTIPDGAKYAWSIATSTGATPIFRIDTSGSGGSGQATTTIQGGFSVNSGALHYDYGANETSIENLNLGALAFDTDAGIVTWIDLPISSAPAAGTVESYTATIDDLDVLTIYGEADGSGGAQNLRVGIGTSTPYAKLSVAGTIVGQNFVGTSTTNSTFGGNVGIGTTSPYAKLSVVGPVVAEYFHATSSSATTTLAGGLNVGSGNLTVLQNGNVGVGTAAPQEAFDVAGKIMGGTFRSDVDNRVKLNLAAEDTAANAFADFEFPDGGVFRVAELDVDGTDDVFFQAFPNTSSGFGYLEAWTSAGLKIGTGNNTAPVIFQVNRDEKARVSSSGFFGIGTTSPYARLSVAGDTVLDSNTITFGSSTASLLNVIYGSAATSTIPDGAKYAWSIATSTGATPIFRIDTSGSGGSGQATTTIQGGFSVNSGALHYDYGGNVTSIENLNLGNLSFEQDAGVVSWINLPISTAPAAGTKESYSAQIDDQSILTIYGEANGSGGVQNTAVGVGTTSPFARLSVAGLAGQTNPLFQVASSTDNPFFTIENLGDVGIGTTTPGANLVINGTTGQNLLQVATSTNQNIFIIDQNGNVGIGTSTPAQQLALSKLLYVGGAGTSTIENNLHVRGTLQAGTGSAFLGDSFLNFNSAATIGLANTTNALNFSSDLLVLDTTNNRIGIGISNPQEELHVQATDDTSVEIRATGADSRAVLEIGNDAETWMIQVEGGNSDELQIRVADSGVNVITIASSSPAKALEFNANSLVVNDNKQDFDFIVHGDVASNLIYVNAGTDRVGVGLTSPSYLFHVSTSTAGAVAGFTDADGTCTIDPTNTALQCTSDARLKKDFSDLENTLEKLSVLSPIRYRWLLASSSDPTRIGFTAQDVQEVFPELVSEQAGGYLSLNYAGFTPILVKAIQELNLKIDDFVGTSTASTTDGTASSLFETFLAWLKDLGVEIAEGFTRIANLVSDRLTVGSPAAPAGVTLFDEVTGEPYCFSIRNGEPTARPGECSELSTSDVDSSDADSGSGGGEGTGDQNDQSDSEDTETGTSTPPTDDSQQEEETATTTDDGSSGDEPEETEPEPEPEPTVEEETPVAEEEQPTEEPNEPEPATEPEQDEEPAPEPEPVEGPDGSVGELAPTE